MADIKKPAKTTLAQKDTDVLLRRAFDNSLQPTILSEVKTGCILRVNAAAARLLGVSKKGLETQQWTSLFDTQENSFKSLVRQRNLKDQSSGFVTLIRQKGKRTSCAVTSAVFTGEDGIPKAVTTITDLSEQIFLQKNIDREKDKIVAGNITTAISRQKDIDTRNKKLVAYNIILAKSKQRNIDLKNRKIVANNILLARSRQKTLDIKNESIRLRQIADAREEGRETERSGMGMELHDNVNQLLGASKMYLDMGKLGGDKSQMYLGKSSEYILSAIEEIRKITRGVLTHMIKTLGLCEAISTMIHDIMEVTGLKIVCRMEGLAEKSINEKFKLNAFRIIQEHLNNIVKYARASNVQIILLQDKNSLTLSVTDDGIGFNMSKIAVGKGMQNIKSRAEELNGAARFFSQPGHGCVLAITFPY